MLVLHYDQNGVRTMTYTFLHEITIDLVSLRLLSNDRCLPLVLGSCLGSRIGAGIIGPTSMLQTRDVDSTTSSTT